MLDLEEVIKQIGEANPFLGDILQCEMTLQNYVSSKLTAYNPNQVHLDRQQKYVKLIDKKINRLFPNEKIHINYKEGMILDTTAHHNILNHPTILGAHLISRFDTLLNREEYGDYYVLDCGHVPFSDVLHKRGVEFGGKHLNLYPKSSKNKSVSGYPLYTFDLLAWVKKSSHKFNQKEITFLKHLQRIIDEIDFSSCERLSDQIVKINYYLWLEFFDLEIRDKVRRCITLEHDEILSDYLADFLLKDQQNIIWRSLFDISFRKKILNRFDGIYGAWNYSGQGTGTYFFWGFNSDTCREYRMVIEGNKLVNKEGLVRDVELTPKEISKALQEGILVPSIFTKFGIVSFYLGAKVMGGPGQTEYAHKLHQAWLSILKDTDESEYELMQEVTVKNYNCGDLVFHVEDEKLVKEWAFDVAMNNTLNKNYLKKLGNMKFKDLIYPSIPISYYRLTPAADRQKFNFNKSDLYIAFNWIKYE